MSGLPLDDDLFDTLAHAEALMSQAASQMLRDTLPEGTSAEEGDRAIARAYLAAVERAKVKEQNDDLT